MMDSALGSDSSKKLESRKVQWLDTTKHHLGRRQDGKRNGFSFSPGLASCFLLDPSQRDSRAHASKSSFLLFSVGV